jgi:hypothetical protein
MCYLRYSGNKISKGQCLESKIVNVAAFLTRVYNHITDTQKVLYQGRDTTHVKSRPYWIPLLLKYKTPDILL